MIFRDAEFTLQESNASNRARGSTSSSVLGDCSLFIALLTWSAAPKTITTGSIGRIWPPIIVQAPRAIGTTGTQRACGANQAPNAGWGWAAHYALLRTGAENGSWEGHDHGWWVDHSSRIATGRNTGLAPGICNWLRAGHFAGCEAAGADHLSAGRHLLGVEINLKHTTPRQKKAESSNTILMEIVFGRERRRDSKKTRSRMKISVLRQQPCPCSHLLMPGSSPLKQSPFIWLLIIDPIWYITTLLTVKETVYLKSSYPSILYHFFFPPFLFESHLLWHLII